MTASIHSASDITEAGLWDHTASIAADLVSLHVEAAEEPGTRGGLDAAWRGIMRDLLSATAVEFDGHLAEAAGALSEALQHVIDQAAA